MEERLFWIGLSMGLYSWGTRYWSKDGTLDTRMATTFWHGIFCFLVGFSITLVAVMSIESRAKFQGVAVGLLSVRELYYSLFGGILLGAGGARRAWRFGRSAEDRRYYRTEDLEWAETVFSAVLLAALMMYFVIQAFKIPSGSMRSTLLEGDHLFVNKFIFGVRIPFTHRRLLTLRKVQRGDVVVFRFPSEDPQEYDCGSPQYGKDFIKRVIGLPGDEIKIVDGQLHINGAAFGPEAYAQHLDEFRQPKVDVHIPREEYQKLWESRQLDKNVGNIMRDNFGPVTVPLGSFFMMGDNRDFSCDSRFWGPVADHYLKGKAWLVYWPPSRLGPVR